MKIEINNLKEAKKYLRNKEEINFQNKIFYRLNKFEKFIDEIENGDILEMPKNSKRNVWYTNFGKIYCNKLIVTKKTLYFFDEDILIFEKTKEKTDDIEYSFVDKHGAICSGNPIHYDDEQDKQYIDLNPIPKHWIY